jgi:two-component system OmpR family response regulator
VTKVLIVEDEAHLAEGLRFNLQAEGYAVEVTGDGESALKRLLESNGRFDAVVLDVMLPGIDGFETCRRLRSGDIRTPVLMLTALDSVEDRVAGLDGGADDYLTKPFSLAELGARVRALARRGPLSSQPVMEAGDLRLDPASHRAWRGEAEIPLTRTEFALLETFMRRPGRALSRLDLIEHAWDGQYENRSNVVDVYVGYLRRKLGEPAIETVRGAGYRFQVDGQASAQHEPLTEPT